MAVASEPYAPSVLVSTEGLPEKEWLEYRRRGIGGSDAAAILGISPFATARDLYYDKLKIVPFDDSESNWVAKKMGHLLEDLVAEIFHVKTGYRIYQIKKMFYHPVHTFMLADIDYFVELPKGRTAILEIKTTNYNAKDHWWSEDGQEIVPLNYEAQGRHYRACLRTACPTDYSRPPVLRHLRNEYRPEIRGRQTRQGVDPASCHRPGTRSGSEHSFPPVSFVHLTERIS